MDNNPIFSIIIPTYNRATFIKKTIQSVLDQTFQNFEVIVVDDGSNDNTEEIIVSLRDTRLQYLKKKNEERGAARNFGVRHSKGRYITFLDSDDIVYPHHFSTAFDFLSKNNSPAAFHLGYEIKSDAGNILKRINSIKNINEEIIMGNALSCIGVFVRRDVMLKNLFNRDRALSGLEDWELWLRIAANHKFLSSNIITSVMVQHDQRSVMEINTEKLKTKMERFIFYIFQNPENLKVYGSKLKKTSASALTYTALHLALAGEKKIEAWHYLKRGVRENPLEVFRKRFLTTLKYIILK